MRYVSWNEDLEGESLMCARTNVSGQSTTRKSNTPI